MRLRRSLSFAHSFAPAPFVAATLVAALALPRAARAEDDPRKAQAEALFQEGLRLHDKDHEAEALEKFQKSYAVYPSPTTLVGIGREEQLLGRGLAALRHFREALKQPLLNPRYAQLAKQHIAELEPRFGRVTVTGPSGTKVTIGDATVRLPMDEPLDAEPGTIVAKGDHDGKAFDATALVIAGKAIAIELRAAGAESGNATPSATPPTATTTTSAPGAGNADTVTPPPREAGPSYWTTRHIAGVGAAVVGVGALVTGVVFFSAASSKGDDADRLRAQNPQGCATPSATCTAIHDASDARHTDLGLGWGFAIGGLVAGGAAVVLLWPSSSPTHTARTIELAPRLGGLDLRGTF